MSEHYFSLPTQNNHCIIDGYQILLPVGGEKKIKDVETIWEKKYRILDSRKCNTLIPSHTSDLKCQDI